MSEKTFGVAVAGLGFVGGRAHVPAFRKIPDAELVAVIDVIEELAKKVATKYNTKYYLDHQKALNSPEIDAIVVAVPTPFHYKLASDAIARGKHVLCEMPMTPTITESKTLGEEAEKAGVTLMPDLNFRFTPNYVKAKELIKQGVIGTPLAVTFKEFISAKELATQWPLSSWAWNREKSGGYPDFTLSVWSIDLVRWLLDSEIDDVQWVSNYALLEGIDNFKGYQTMGIIKFASGAVGTLHYSATVGSGQGTSTLEVFGSNTKTLKAKWNNSLILTGDDSEKQEWSFNEKGTKVWGHYQIDSYFVECILQGKQPTITVEDAIKAENIAAKIVRN
ncbi:MAG: Gfo/Idh/MocA family protein [Promethearchaeota archaeon]